VIGVVLGGVTALFTLLPLLEGEPEVVRTGPRGTTRQNLALETLEAEKRRVLRSIRDLDFDYDMGKLTNDVYEMQRLNLIRLGAAIVRRIDVMEAEVRAQQARVDAAVDAFRQQAHKSA
jgi:hypothetical protein